MQLLTPAPIDTAPLKLVERPIPRPGPGQALLQINTCGVCHTDLHTVEGEIHPPRLPIIPGHQVVGSIAELGSPSPGLSAGQRVGVSWLYASDGTCPYCQSGQENLCPNARFTGFDVDGGYAGWMLAGTTTLLPLPDSIDDEAAAPLLCAGIIGYRSLRRAGLQPGETLGLAGFGASAHLALQVAVHWGCPVYVFTRSPAHRRHALELGAAWAGAISDQPPQPLDRAILFAPAGELVPPLLEHLRPGGTLAINAIHLSPIPSLPYGLIYGERTLTSVANLTHADGLEFLRLAAEIPIHPTTNPYPLADANRALQDLKASRLNGEAVLHIA